MGTFSIKDIEAVSGIKSHTIRVWEQRYKILTPKRTDTNFRFYDDEDLKLILNISILNKYGYKISAISKMNALEISEALLKISSNTNEFDYQIKGLIQATMTFDEKTFFEILNTNISQLDFEKTILKIVFPFMTELGFLWQIGSVQPSHEHFASNIIKQKLFTSIDECSKNIASNHKRFLLFLPEHEKHSLGLLFANYVLRNCGHEVLYLGQEVPLKNLKEISVDYSPDYVFTILTSAHLEIGKQKFVNELAENGKNATILLSGHQFLNCDIVFPANTKLIRSPEEFILLIENL